VYFLEVKAAGA